MNSSFISISCGLIGVVIVLTVFLDVFGTAILPRPMRSLRISKMLWSVMWTAWSSRARMLSKNGERREKLLGIDRGEFEHALFRLRTSGYSVRSADEAWPRFVAIRKAYAGDLNILARHWIIPPAQWIGDRSLISPHVSRVRSG